MKNTLLFLLIFISFTSFSQTKEWPFQWKKGSSNKEPSLDKFLGTWVWCNNTQDTLKLELKKIKHTMPDSTSFEGISAEFIYIVKGKVVQDSRKRDTALDSGMGGWLDHHENSKKKN